MGMNIEHAKCGACALEERACLATCMWGSWSPCTQIPNCCGNFEVEGNEHCDDGCTKGDPNKCEEQYDNGDGCDYQCHFE